MRRLCLLAAALVALIALPARAAEDLPPPPPPPGDDVPLPPPPPGTARKPAGEPAPAAAAAGPRIGDGPITTAGFQVAPLRPDEAVSSWKLALASGVLGRFGGKQISSDHENPSVLIYFGGQADGAWSKGMGRAARLRLKMMTGGEDEIFLPSDGEVEAAYFIGRPEFRFVAGRLEVARYPNLGLEVFAQLSTLPSVEGSISLAGDRMRLDYFVAPIEMAYVIYYGDAHISGDDAAASEADEPAAATAARLRYTVLLPPSVLFSLQAELVKMWKKPDLMLGGEGSLGYQVLDRSVTFNVAIRWSSYERRGPASDADTATASDLKLMAMATLVF